MTLERRVEGAAFVVPDDAFRHANELGPLPFPWTGTRGHAALLLSDHAATVGTQTDAPGPGWRGLTDTDVTGALASFAAEYATGRGGWSSEYSGDITHLAADVAELLTGINALRVIDAPASTAFGPAASETGRQAVWWFAPVTGRWADNQPGIAIGDTSRRRRSRTADLMGNTDILLLLGLL
nr:DUF2398 family protein [Microbacterium ulmi]